MTAPTDRAETKDKTRCSICHGPLSERLIKLHVTAHLTCIIESTLMEKPR